MFCFGEGRGGSVSQWQSRTAEVLLRQKRYLWPDMEHGIATLVGDDASIYENLSEIAVTVAMRVGADTIEKRGRLEQLEEKPAKLAGSEKTEKRCSSLEKIPSLRSEQFLAEWLSIAKNLCRADGLVVAKLHLLSTLELLRNLHLGKSRVLKKCLVRYLSSETVSRHAFGLSGKRKRLSVVKTSVLKTCYSIMSRSEKRYALLEMLVDFAK